MVERTVDHEDEVVREALPCNQVLRIGHDGTMADDNTFRLTCRTRSIEHVSRALRHLTGRQPSGNLLKQGLWRILLQRGSHTACQMDGQIGDEEVYRLRGAESDYLSTGEIRCPLLYPLPELGISQRLLATDHSRFLRIALGIQP